MTSRTTGCGAVGRKPQSRRTRRSLHRSLALLVVFISALGIGTSTAQNAQTEITPAAVRADFDALWHYVADNYAYFDSRLTNWAAVPDLYKSDLERVKTRSELVALLEHVLDELYDAHAQLTVNTPSSPRLVPSGADIWAEWQQGRAIVEEVREGSDAERAGMRAGAEILAVNDVPIAYALRTRTGRSLRRVDDNVRSWALRAVLAGYHNQQRRIRFRFGGSDFNRTVPAADQFVTHEDRLVSRTLPTNVGYVRLQESLGDSRLIPEFDSALARHEPSAGGLILDLRDTPGGGNTTVAQAILGRFVRIEKPYQKHLLPSEERETGVRRSWLELVTPRGRSAYPQSVVVLVGHWTGSMGEGLAIGFDAVGAATIVGTPMAQLLGATYHFELPQSHIGINIPAEKLFHVNGTSREAFVPQVRLTREDLSDPSGDPWMKQALKVLSNRHR